MVNKRDKMCAHFYLHAEEAHKAKETNTRYDSVVGDEIGSDYFIDKISTEMEQSIYAEMNLSVTTQVHFCS